MFTYEINFNFNGVNAPVVAYCSISINDSFIIRDCKLIILDSGKRILSIPNSKKEVRCPYCRKKTAFNSHYCSHCGKSIKDKLRNMTHSWTEFYEHQVLIIDEVERNRLKDYVYNEYLKAIQQNKR